MQMSVVKLLVAVSDRERSRRAIARDESGMATAELLGNAALGIGALVVIWGLLRTLGVDVITWMGDQIGVG